MLLYLGAQRPKTLLRLTIVWIMTISVLSILWPVNSLANNTQIKIPTSFMIDGITIKIMLKGLTGRKSCIQKNLHEHFWSEGYKKFVNEVKDCKK